jgi:NADPH:quinone reductase-like Zn-dependent oxidoreductase
MRAITQVDYGSAQDVLRMEEIEVPTIGGSEVLIRVRAIGLGPHVWHNVTGRPFLARIGSGMRHPKARVPHSDLAGIVEAVGSDVTQFRPGDEVYGVSDGAFAEYACAPTSTIALKPRNLTFEQAAAVPVSACAALHGLREVGRITAGQRVLVIGASGGVGTFAVQLAKAFDTEVTGVCSTAKLDLVRSIGADHVIDYTQEDVADGTNRYDLILDTAGRRPLSQLRKALAKRGTLVIVGGEGGGPLMGGFDRALFRATLLSPFVGQRLRPVISTETQADLIELTGLLEAGTIVPVVTRTFTLEEAPSGLSDAEEGHGRGKAVVTLGA